MYYWEVGGSSKGDCVVRVKRLKCVQRGALIGRLSGGRDSGEACACDVRCGSAGRMCELVIPSKPPSLLIMNE